MEASRPDRELLGAAALCRHPIPEGPVHAFLAEHGRRLFPDEMFPHLFRRGGRGHRRARIALLGDGTHSVSLDETSLGGLAVNVVERRPKRATTFDSTRCCPASNAAEQVGDLMARARRAGRQTTHRSRRVSREVIRDRRC